MNAAAAQAAAADFRFGISPLSVFWRVVGALKFRVAFV